MANINDLLQGCIATTPDEIANHILSKATELKVKLFLDDGKDHIYIPKSRLDAEITKVSNLQTQVSTQQSTIETLKKATKGDEKAQQTIEELEGKIADLNSKFEKATMSVALRAKASELGAIDETGEDLLAFIDKSTLKVKEDGSVDGLDNALKSLKESKAYLFKAEDPKPNAGDKGGIQTPNPNNPTPGGVFGTPSYVQGSFGSMLANGGQVPNPSNQPSPVPTPTKSHYFD